MNKPKTYNSPLIDELIQEISPEQLERTEKRMLLAARIDEAIKAKGWKKKDLAKALGKTPSEITKWLSGTHNFTSDTIFDIERVLHIKLINLDNKPREITTTFFYNITTQSASKPEIYWGAILRDEKTKNSYKAKSQLNTDYSN